METGRWLETSGGLGVPPHEDSGSEQECLRVLRGSGDKLGQWLKGFWWYIKVNSGVSGGTTGRDCGSGSGLRVGTGRDSGSRSGLRVGTGRNSGSGGLQCCWHCPCLRPGVVTGEGTT